MAATATGGAWACCDCSGVVPTAGNDKNEIVDFETAVLPQPYVESNALETFKDPVQVATPKESNPVSDFSLPGAAGLEQDVEAAQAQAPQQGAKALVRAVFRVPEQTEQVVRFKSRPLGLTFDPHSQHLKISSAVGQAASLGVRAGWTVKAAAATSIRSQSCPPEETDKKRPSWSRCDVKGAPQTAPELYKSIKRNCEALPVVKNATTLEVVVQTNGVSKAFTFDRRPLGLSLSGTLPLRVTKADGQAAMLGVQEGSLLVSVGGHALTDLGLPYADVVKRMSTLVQNLPYDDSPSGFPVVFGDDIGQTHKVIFEYKPLGISLAKSALPLKVTSVTPRAEDEGIMTGWTVKSVAGKDVTGPSWTYDKVEALLKCCMAPLPSRSKPKPRLDLLLVPDSREVVVHFTRSPLDLSFKPGSDLTVAKAGGHSMELGIKPDWVLCGIDGQDVSKIGAKDSLKLLTEAEARLPQENSPKDMSPPSVVHC